jgi:hypothetical protein
MKLRIKGNTIRFRLTKSEVEYFGNTFFIEEQTLFPDNALSYSLKSFDGDILSATFSNNRVTVLIPFVIAKDWVVSNKVGLEGEVEIGNGKKLYILIEKDFKCLDNTIEDQSDNYENPLANSAR